jgi:hypothetical protein
MLLTTVGLCERGVTVAAAEILDGKMGIGGWQCVALLSVLRRGSFVSKLKHLGSGSNHPCNVHVLVQIRTVHRVAIRQGGADTTQRRVWHKGSQLALLAACASVPTLGGVCPPLPNCDPMYC